MKFCLKNYFSKFRARKYIQTHLGAVVIDLVNTVEYTFLFYGLYIYTLCLYYLDNDLWLKLILI